MLQQTNKQSLPATFPFLVRQQTSKPRNNKKKENYPPAGHFSIPVLACAPLPASLASPAPPRGAAPPERLFKGDRAKMSKPPQVAKVNVIK